MSVEEPTLEDVQWELFTMKLKLQLMILYEEVKMLVAEDKFREAMMKCAELTAPMNLYMDRMEGRDVRLLERFIECQNMIGIDWDEIKL